MDNSNEPKSEITGGGDRGFLTSILGSLARDALRLVLAFGVGTGAGAIVCRYYGLPMALSLGGGVLTRDCTGANGGQLAQPRDS